MNDARARDLMETLDVAALVIVQPENFTYATGASPGFAALWRRAGAAIALFPADANVQAGAVVADAMAAGFRTAAPGYSDVRTHPLWVETEDLTALLPSHDSTQSLLARAAKGAGKARERSRPCTYDFGMVLEELRGLLHERGFEGRRLGIELEFVPVADFERIKAALPQVTFIDSSPLFARLRTIKSAEEIGQLRLGAELTEAGIRTALAGARAGQSATELSFAYRRGVMDEALRRDVHSLESTWDIISVGPQPWGPGATTARIESGAQLKFDVGCTVGGYQADVGRTYVFGRGNDHQRHIHDALHGAFEAGRAELRPGNPIKHVHAAAQRAMHEAGFRDYIRGHFGHGIGANVWHEEWPYICATEELPLEAGMVFSFETPYYVGGVGGFIIEDHIAITADGHESLNSLERGYQEINP